MYMHVLPIHFHRLDIEQYVRQTFWFQSLIFRTCERYLTYDLRSCHFHVSINTCSYDRSIIRDDTRIVCVSSFGSLKGVFSISQLKSPKMFFDIPAKFARILPTFIHHREEDVEHLKVNPSLCVDWWHFLIFLDLLAEFHSPMSIDDNQSSKHGFNRRIDGGKSLELGEISHFWV